MKILLGIAALTFIISIGFVLWSSNETPVTVPLTKNSSEQMDSKIEQGSKNKISEGMYSIQSENSIVNWAGKKPLIDGYIDSGSIGIHEGSISITNKSVNGQFKINMNTLSVSETPKAPGKESILESHLKSENWFNVDAFPEATFTISQATQRTDNDTEYLYDFIGALAMKGVTEEISFPAYMYTDTNEILHIDATFEIDRTRWGITTSSGSFFDNLADNVVDDMVSLSFSVLAVKQQK